MDLVRVLIVSDNILLADVVGRTLAEHENLVFAGYMRERELLAKKNVPPTDVVLLYFESPLIDVARLIRVMADVQPEAQAIAVVSESDLGTTAPRMVEAGAKGCVLHTVPIAELIETIKAVRSGSSRCHERVAHAVLERIRELSGQMPLTLPPPGAPLTRRERQILHLVSLGLSNKRIARDLGISLSTAENHVHNVFAKLGVKSRREATLLARTWKILGAPHEVGTDDAQWRLVRPETQGQLVGWS